MKSKIPIILALLVSVLIVLPLFMSSNRKNTEHKTADEPSISNYVPVFSDRSEDAQKRFWTTCLEKTFNELFEGKSTFTEVQGRVTELREQIELLYSKPVAVRLITTYHYKSRTVAAGAWFDQGVPVIEIVVQRQMDIAESLRSVSKENFEQQLKVSFLSSIHHELEHLVFDRGKTHQNTDELIRSEKYAWAQSCRFAIVPSIEKYGIIPNSDSLDWYQAWKRSGGNENSPAWNDYVSTVYREAGLEVR